MIFLARQRRNNCLEIEPKALIPCKQLNASLNIQHTLYKKGKKYSSKELLKTLTRINNS